MVRNKIEIFVISIIALSLFVISCKVQNENVKTRKILLTITNIKDSTYLYLENRNTSEIIDTTMIINSKGEFKFKIEKPEPFTISNYIDRGKYLWLDDADINIIGEYADFRNLLVTGSESNKLSEIYLHLESEFEKDIERLDELKNKTNRNDYKFDYNKQILLRNGEYRKKIISTMKKYNDSYVTLDKLSWECNNYLSKLEILDVLLSLTPRLKKSELAKNIQHFVNLPPVPHIGELYVDFTQYTPEGDTISLINYEGKNTLVLYWSTTCYGSVLENPNLIKAYEKYHPLGLEVIGVSEESDRVEWLEGIKRAKLPWTLVSDLKGRFNEVGLLYNFKMTPYNILINKKGIITHRNLREKQLHSVLEEIFN